MATRILAWTRQSYDTMGTAASMMSWSIPDGHNAKAIAMAIDAEGQDAVNRCIKILKPRYPQNGLVIAGHGVTVVYASGRVKIFRA